MSQITTHILDASLGIPASGVAVTLQRRSGDDWTTVAEGVTDDDGRVRDLGPDAVDDDVYRLVFDTGSYFARAGRDTFYPQVDIVFTISTSDHYHVPILLSPFAYTTYRGS